VAFTPEYSREEVERLVAAGGLSLIEVYRLEHQHPLNQLTHAIGIPSIALSLIYPAWIWVTYGYFAWISWLALGGGGWALQFLGHAIEGNKPAFVADPRQFAMGPVFFLAKPYFWLYERFTGRPYFRKLTVPPETSSSATEETPA
jgi:hypothetical protein